MEALDGDAAATHLSAAIRTFTAAGDNRQAALASARLGDVFANAIGNQTAARAWFRRAARMLENEPPCIEQGWVAVAAMGCDVDDPAELLANAELALDRARRFGDVNLETKALADGGLAHVQAGRVAEGMALLDEAMALACGPADDQYTAGKSVCSFFTACFFAFDFDRASSWVDALRGRGLIGKGAAAPILLASHCDSVQATLLCELGRWDEAEAMLTRAIDNFEQATGIPSWHPAIALAELRMRQGRLADAEALLLGKEGRFQALLPAARLHLARGDYELARATAARGLRVIGADRLRAPELFAVLVDVELGLGDTEAAQAVCEQLIARAEGLDVPALAARVASVLARTRAAAGDHTRAIETLESALDELPDAGLPYLQASLLFDLARFHEESGNTAAARLEASRAVAVMDRLDVVLSSVDAARLRRLGVTPPAAPASGVVVATLAKQATGWVVTCGQDRAQLRDSKGLQYLAELVRNPGVERHALDLVDRVEGVSPASGGPDRRRLGDAGPALDARARTAYRHRIEALRSEVDDALDTGNEDRAEALQSELDDLVAELASAFGLGGRDRRTASAAERARLNVTRALRTAVGRVAGVLPEAGGALDRGLRTGLYCAFAPNEDEAVRWIVQS